MEVLKILGVLIILVLLAALLIWFYYIFMFLLPGIVCLMLAIISFILGMDNLGVLLIIAGIFLNIWWFHCRWFQDHFRR
jgi:hypothetical protein